MALLPTSIRVDIAAVTGPAKVLLIVVVAAFPFVVGLYFGRWRLIALTLLQLVIAFVLYVGGGFIEQALWEREDLAVGRHPPVTVLAWAASAALTLGIVPAWSGRWRTWAGIVTVAAVLTLAFFVVAGRGGWT